MRGWEVTKGLQCTTFKSLQISTMYMSISAGHRYICIVIQSTGLFCDDDDYDNDNDGDYDDNMAIHT